MSAWCWARRPMPARASVPAPATLSPCEGERGGVSFEQEEFTERTLLFAWGQRAADDALAGALRDLDDLLGPSVLAALARTGVRAAGAVVLARLGDAVALFRIGVVGRERRRGQGKQAADGCSQNRSLRGHRCSSCKLVH